MMENASWQWSQFENRRDKSRVLFRAMFWTFFHAAEMETAPPQKCV